MGGWWGALSRLVSVSPAPLSAAVNRKVTFSRESPPRWRPIRTASLPLTRGFAPCAVGERAPLPCRLPPARGERAGREERGAVARGYNVFTHSLATKKRAQSVSLSRSSSKRNPPLALSTTGRPPTAVCGAAAATLPPLPGRGSRTTCQGTAAPHRTREPVL